MTKRDEWLNELRNDNVEGVPASGPYNPRKDVIQEMCGALGVAFPFNEPVLKSDLRSKVNEFFGSR